MNVKNQKVIRMMEGIETTIEDYQEALWIEELNDNDWWVEAFRDEAATFALKERLQVRLIDNRSITPDDLEASVNDILMFIHFIDDKGKVLKDCVTDTIRGFKKKQEHSFLNYEDYEDYENKLVHIELERLLKSSIVNALDISDFSK
nr:hypothetical protein [Moritella viscosa]SHO14674.1 Putative uncharacterized protein [Moritella viscosa]